MEGQGKREFLVQKAVGFPKKVGIESEIGSHIICGVNKFSEIISPSMELQIEESRRALTNEDDLIPYWLKEVKEDELNIMEEEKLDAGQMKLNQNKEELLHQIKLYLEESMDGAKIIENSQERGRLVKYHSSYFKPRKKEE